MKKEAVNQQSIYVHIDHVINNVATSGISFCDFLNGVGQPPENILLIKHNIILKMHPTMRTQLFTT